MACHQHHLTDPVSLADANIYSNHLTRVETFRSVVGVVAWQGRVVLIAVDVLNAGDVKGHNKPTGQMFSSEFCFKIIIFKPENQKYQENGVDFHDRFAV